MKTAGYTFILISIVIIFFCLCNYEQTLIPQSVTELILEAIALIFMSFGFGILITLSKYKQQ